MSNHSEVLYDTFVSSDSKNGCFQKIHLINGVDTKQRLSDSDITKQRATTTKQQLTCYKTVTTAKKIFLNIQQKHYVIYFIYI